MMYVVFVLALLFIIAILNGRWNGGMSGLYYFILQTQCKSNSVAETPRFCSNTLWLCFWCLEFNLQMKEFYSGERILIKKPVYYKTDEQPEVWFTAEQVWEVRGAGSMKTQLRTIFHLKAASLLPILVTHWLDLSQSIISRLAVCLSSVVFPCRSHPIACSPCGHWVCPPIAWHLGEDAEVHPLGSRSEPRGL
jgi:hypothetical protein